MKVFGCKAFAHVSKKQRQKLDDRSIFCIFIGYEMRDLAIGYGIQKKKRILRSRDIVFHEEETMPDLWF